MSERPERQKKKNLFERESEIVKSSKTIMQRDDLSLEECKNELSVMVGHYEELVDQSKLITKVSDRLQKKINKANDALETKNDELQQTLDALTQAKVGRRATTITLMVFVVLFLVSEAFVEPQIEGYAESHFDSSTTILGFSLGFKGLLALLLRPIEKIVEKILLKQAQRRAENEAQIQQNVDDAERNAREPKSRAPRSAASRA